MHWIVVAIASLVSATGLGANTSELPSPHLQCGFAHQTAAWRANPRKETTVRPPGPHTKISTMLPIRLHWQDGVSSEYADQILSDAEQSWQKLFHGMGFLPPHPDGDLGGDSLFDIYIVTDLDAGIGGYASFSGFFEATPRADAFGYLVINNNIDPRIRRFVVAHELFHGSQMAYDWWEDISFMEGSATWVVDHVFDDEDIYWRYYEFFNKQPYLASDFISLKNPYQYGSGLWLQFLDEAYGDGSGSFIREIWEQTIQDGFENEPDFLDIIETKTEAGLASAWQKFGEWRVMVGTRERGQHFSEGAVWDARMDPYFEAVATSGMTRIEGTTSEGLGPYSHAFLRWQRPGTSADQFSLTIEQSADRRLMVDVLWLSADHFTKQTLGSVQGASTWQAQGQSPGIFTEAIFIISDVTDGNYDADTSPWTQHPFNYNISLKSLPVRSQ